MLRKPIILIDNGHGIDTPGKRSPDGLFREYKYAREIACGVADCLQALGETVFLLVKETNDVPLAERVARVNAYCRQYGAGNVIVVSIHVNAGPGSGWSAARGWCVYTSPGQTVSDIIATHLFAAASEELKHAGYFDTFKPGVQKPLRKDYSDGDPDIEEAFYILRKTACPAVLTENCFQNNREDVAFLTSDNGKGAIIALHVDGILNYLKDIRK